MTAISNDAKRTPNLLGVPIGCGSLVQVATRSLRAIDGAEGPVTFACANPHSLVEACENENFLAALRSTDLVVADGVGVSLVGWLLRIDVGPRITGAEYYTAMMDALAQRGSGRVFFFGSSDSVLQRIADKISVDYPELTLCGMLSPPYREWSQEENEEMLDRINEARPDLLWVGMTAPKQELWVRANAARLNARVIGSVGAVFDFYAGTSPRAPDWMRQAGLEWVYRLAREPRRLWRRTIVSAPRFIGKVLSYHLFAR